MNISDPIADMLTRIRNANTAKHDTVDIPLSKMKVAIANILVDEGYIAKYEIVPDGNFQVIRVYLKYENNKSVKIISGLKKISKPGLRVYADHTVVATDADTVVGSLVQGENMDTDIRFCR